MADIHDFTIETGNTFEITFSYTDEDNVPLDLANHCVFLRWLTDTGEEYTLEYFLGNETLVVKKPNSDQAWLFTRVGS